MTTKMILEKYFDLDKRREFSRFEAVYDVIRLCKKAPKNNSLDYSLAELQKRWGWPNRNKVNYILNLLEKDGLLVKWGKKYRLGTVAANGLERIEVVEVKEEKNESIESGIPMLAVEGNLNRQGVPPTTLFNATEKPEYVIDLVRVRKSRNTAEKVPLTRFYLKYTDENKFYVVDESDTPALKGIIRKLESLTRKEYGGSDNDRFKRLLLNNIDKFIANVGKTFYAGKSLSLINNKFNDVVSAIIAAKKSGKIN